MAEFPVSINLSAVDGASSKIDKISRKLNGLSIAGGTGRLQKQTKGLNRSLGSLGATSGLLLGSFGSLGGLVAGGSLAAGIGLSVKNFATFEKALVGVGKTTNIEGKALEELGEGFKRLSERLPESAAELAAIGQAAGQAGITGSKNILKFTETVAKLGGASDLAGEEAANTLAKLLNITNEGAENVDKLASSFVALGNSFPVTEAGIARVASEMGKSAADFRFSSGQVVALSAAMGSLGIQAQLGGSSIGKTLRTIVKVADEGGRAGTVLETILGKSRKQIKKDLEKSPFEVLRQFLERLSVVSKEGPVGAVAKALAGIGLEGDEINKVLPVLAGRFDRVTEALKIVNREQDVFNKGLKDQTALNQEAAKALDTTDSKFKMLNNRIRNSSIVIGKEFAPALLGIAERALPVIEFAASQIAEKLSAVFNQQGTVMENMKLIAEGMKLEVEDKLSDLIIPETKAPIELAVKNPDQVKKVIEVLNKSIETKISRGAGQDEINRAIDKRNRLLGTLNRAQEIRSAQSSAERLGELINKFKEEGVDKPKIDQLIKEKSRLENKINDISSAEKKDRENERFVLDLEKKRKAVLGARAENEREQRAQETNRIQSESKVIIDFRNAPEGTQVRTEGNSAIPIQTNLGFQGAGAL